MALISSSLFEYWVMRLGRKCTPPALIDYMLTHAIGLQPGLDTRDPAGSVQRYQDAVEAEGRRLDDAVVLVLGYGGTYGVALELLERGVSRVVLQDPFAKPRRAVNEQLDAKRMQPFFARRQQAWVPRDDRVWIWTSELDAYTSKYAGSCDLVVSSSVLEHVADVEGLVRAMQRLMAPAALAVHFIDLRDHFFKFPFEMLCYSERVWNTFLNADNNLNRLRAGEHRQAFEKYFNRVDITVLGRLPEPWGQVESRVRPEFKTGDPEIDAISYVLLLASSGPARP